MFVELEFYFGEREELRESDTWGEFSHGHDFDEGDIESVISGPLDESDEFVIIEVIDGDGVDFDLEVGVFCGLESVEDGFEVSALGDLVEALGVEGIERDVDSPHACVV